jgi:hypothetical protein
MPYSCNQQKSTQSSHYTLLCLKFDKIFVSNEAVLAYLRIIYFSHGGHLGYSSNLSDTI